MHRGFIVALAFSALLAFPAAAQDSDKSDNFDVKSTVGDLHMGKDADAHKAGLPLYPGARPERADNDDPLNLAILTESFGFKVIVAKYQSDDPAEKILAFYREKMKKYGKVLECHNHGDDNESHGDSDADRNRPLKCNGDNTGPVQELKVGTEGNAHIVSIEPRDSGKGTSFAIVYFHQRGKSGDI